MSCKYVSLQILKGKARSFTNLRSIRQLEGDKSADEEGNISLNDMEKKDTLPRGI